MDFLHGYVNSENMIYGIRYLFSLIPLKYTTVVRGIALFLASGLILPAVSTIAEAQKNPYEFKIGHPRIIMTKYDELALRFVLMEDPVAAKLKNELKKDADIILNAKNIKYALDKNRTMTTISREYFKRILTLSLAYRIFEEDKYSDKAIDMMMHVCAFPDWNPDYFPDVAEMTAALAIGYDWNFYHLNLRQKETIRNRILEFGLRPGLDVYNNSQEGIYQWYKFNDHWNQVCAGGLILGALAIGEDFPDIKNNIIYLAVKNLAPTLELYEPDGFWYEGQESWYLANTYLALTFSALGSALEHDFGLSDLPGINKTAGSYQTAVSPAGYLFNFGETSMITEPLAAHLFWFAKRFKLENVAGQYKNQLINNVTTGNPDYGKGRDRFFYLSLPWFNEGEKTSSNAPNLTSFKGISSAIFLRSGGEKSALFLAAKGGKSQFPNQHLDAGSFVIDADGERWGIDPGVEKIFLPWEKDQFSGNKRWENPRNTNLAHNTITLNDAIQYADGEGRIIRQKDGVAQPLVVMDLTSLYAGVSSVQRGFKLLNNDQVLVRDEIIFTGEPGSVRWTFITDAKVELKENVVILTKNGKQFIIHAFAPQNVKFTIEPVRNYVRDAGDVADKNMVVLKLNEERNNRQIDISIVMGRNVTGLSDVIVNSKLSGW